MDNKHHVRGVFWGDTTDCVILAEENRTEKWTFIFPNSGDGIVKQNNWGEDIIKLKKNDWGIDCRLDYTFTTKGLCRLELGFYYYTPGSGADYVYTIENMNLDVYKTLNTIYGNCAPDYETKTWVVHDDETVIELHSDSIQGHTYMGKTVIAIYHNGNGGADFPTDVKIDRNKEKEKVKNMILNELQK